MGIVKTLQLRAKPKLFVVKDSLAVIGIDQLIFVN